MPNGIIINPNSGTEWAGPPVVSGKKLSTPPEVAKRMQDGDPNRFTDWTPEGAPKEDPALSAANKDSENRDYLCRFCHVTSHSMTEFNEHCAIDARGNGREMTCEVEYRFRYGIGAPPLWSGASANDTPIAPGAVPGSPMDPSAIAQATALALAPSLNAITEVLSALTRQLSGKPPKKKPGPPKGKKYGRRAASLPGAAPPSRPAPLRGVGLQEEPVVDSPQEPEAPPSA